MDRYRLKIVFFKPFVQLLVNLNIFTIFISLERALLAVEIDIEIVNENILVPLNSSATSLTEPIPKEHNNRTMCDLKIPVLELYLCS